MKRFIVSITFLVPVLAWPSSGPDSGKLPDSADKDYKAELTALPPKEPGEALEMFRLRPGFRIELVAAEPLIRSPVAIDFDENGRLFVVEFPEYNQYANKNFKGKGCVKLLEDTDGDGRYDKSSVYVDNLDSPVAVACYEDRKSTRLNSSHIQKSRMPSSA